MAERIQLTDEQQQQLEGLAGRVRELRAELARAREAGLDVGELEAMLEESERLRAGLLRVYGREARRIGPVRS